MLLLYFLFLVQVEVDVLVSIRTTRVLRCDPMRKFSEGDLTISIEVHSTNYCIDLALGNVFLVLNEELPY